MSGEASDPHDQGQHPDSKPEAEPATSADVASTSLSDEGGSSRASETGAATADAATADAATADIATPDTATADAATASPDTPTAADAATADAVHDPTPGTLETAAQGAQPSPNTRSLAGLWQLFKAGIRGKVEPLPIAEELVEREARSSVWGSAGRCLALGLLFGLSLVAWVRFSFDADWVVEFLTKNQLDMPQRMTLISSMLLGGVGAVLAVSGIIAYDLRRREPLAKLEGWLWFLSPLTLLPTLPLFLRYDAWADKHAELLPALLFVGLVLELLVFQALKSVPGVIKRSLEATKKEVPHWLMRHGPIALVIGAALAYVVFMSFYTIRWHHKLGTGNYDLGINNNLMYGGLHGDFNQSRIVFPEQPERYINNHVKLGAYFFLPIYALVPRPETLQVIQSVLLGMGAVPLFLFARRHVTQWMAAVIALSWLCYYPMHSANFYEVELVPIASFFVLTAAWAADARRFAIMGVAFAVGMLLREDMAIGFAVLGGFLLLSGHRPRAGLIMAGVASVWFVFVRFYVMDEAANSWFPRIYRDLWADGETGLSGVLKTLVSNPFFTLTHVLTETKVTYLLHLLVPLLFLPARRLYLWASFVPGALLTLLVTDYKQVTMYSFHYVMHWAPYIFLGVPLMLAAYARQPAAGALRAKAALCGMAFSVAVLSYNYGAFTGRDGTLRSGYQRVTFSMSAEERQTYAELVDIISEIPREASVAADEKTGPHVSSRRVFYSLRQGSYHADYVLVHKRGLGTDRTKEVVARALASGEYGVKRRVGEFVLLKLKHSTADNGALVNEWHLPRPREVTGPPRPRTGPGNGEPELDNQHDQPPLE